MINPLSVATTLGSFTLFGSSKTGLKNSDTHVKIFRIAISCLGLAAASSYFGLSPDHATAALLSLKGEDVLNIITRSPSSSIHGGFSKSNNITVLTGVALLALGMLGLAKHSVPLLGFCLAVKVAAIYFSRKNLSDYGIKLANPRTFVPLILEASILGAVAVGSAPLLTGAVVASLAWNIHVNLAHLESSVS